MIFQGKKSVLFKTGMKGHAVWMIAVWAMLSAGCRKSEYNKVDQAAYLRVFNTLNYVIDISTKGKPVPFLTMLIDPQFSGDKKVTGATMMGDFLDTRSRYAPPASNAAGTSYINTEFPGKLKIPAAPIINGFDLSGWAQVPSGKHRFVFYTRPLNAIPFFELTEAERQSQQVLADTILDLTAGEVYTMNLLEKDVLGDTLSTLVYLRQEQFTKMAFADSLIYFNFYNLSAEGYVEAHPEGSVSIDYTHQTGTAIKNQVNIVYSLFRDDVLYPYTIENGQEPRMGYTPIDGHIDIPLQSLERSLQPVVAPYNTIPLFAGKDTSGGIMNRQWMRLTVRPPGGGAGENRYSPANGLIISFTNESDEGRTQIRSGGIGHAPGFLLPNLVRQAASGPYRQRSFATVSSIEFINKKIYLTSIQRTYPPPVNE